MHHEPAGGGGFTLGEALRAATVVAAGALRLVGKVGVLAAGTRAVMVLLARSPLERIQSLLTIREVCLQGREVQ
ncbi:MAG: amidohydrolase family protein [bacterium]|nr:amidohydrolase family protein [bacterium]MDW8104114.1 amidohydrolase family protein [Armatimonadota bacterium]